MNAKAGDGVAPDVHSVCKILDKLTLKQLHLMEEKMDLELMMESTINNGSLHLAKSRYIMGQSSVSSTKLPSECSSEFSASAVCEETGQEGARQLKVVSNTADDTVNPLHWFGVLVPQNLHRAQGIFKNAVDYIMDLVNVQLQLEYNLETISVLKHFKTTIQ